jgi:hypothetical protein
VGDKGLEKVRDSSENLGGGDLRADQNDDPDLAAVVAAWPELTAEQRREVLAIVGKSYARCESENKFPSPP